MISLKKDKIVYFIQLFRILFFYVQTLKNNNVYSREKYIYIFFALLTLSIYASIFYSGICKCRIFLLVLFVLYLIPKKWVPELHLLMVLFTAPNKAITLFGPNKVQI